MQHIQLKLFEDMPRYTPDQKAMIKAGIIENELPKDFVTISAIKVTEPLRPLGLYTAEQLWEYFNYQMDKKMEMFETNRYMYATQVKRMIINNIATQKYKPPVQPCT